MNASRPITADFPFGTKATLPNIFGSLYDHGDSSHTAMLMILAVMMISLGLFIAFYGFSQKKAVVFIDGFLFGMVIVYDSSIPLHTQIIISIVTGAMSGCVALLQMKIALSMKGFVAGFILGHIALSLIQPYQSLPEWLQLCFLLATSIALATMAVRKEREAMISATAGIGSYLLSFSVYFATLSLVNRKGQPWIPGVMTAVVAAAAAYYQAKVSAKDKKSDTFKMWFKAEENKSGFYYLLDQILCRS
ncbi:hypothetical protein Ae201684P_011850 [Aphanomyces euteiches]|uniref:Transmembrane protein 198 n=2 Tax=Aphanomyces euteiches TaxID=100861 RepID=A0A6G0WUV4_9STRA|nr:hypothetical protein Ae201684_011488 [Aphanomyces euteiches]KAH9097124.1 hypothetical protein Ae201684P_011850 [Aphanomyces euteiches]